MVSIDKNQIMNCRPSTGKGAENATPYLKPALITLAILLTLMTLTAIGLSVYGIITLNKTTTTTTTTSKMLFL